MMSQPLKSTITAAAVSAAPAREGVLDSTCSRNKRGTQGRPGRHRQVGRRQPRPLAEESRGQIVPERCSQQSFPAALHSISNRPPADDEIMQDRIADMPIQIRIDDMPGAAAHGPGTSDARPRP